MALVARLRPLSIVSQVANTLRHVRELAETFQCDELAVFDISGGDGAAKALAAAAERNWRRTGAGTTGRGAGGRCGRIIHAMHVSICPCWP